MEKPLTISAPDCYPVPELSPVQALLCLQDLPSVTFLDSSGNQAGMGRYSFLMADPFAALVYNRDGLFWNDQHVMDNPWLFFRRPISLKASTVQTVLYAISHIICFLLVKTAVCLITKGVNTMSGGSGT